MSNDIRCALRPDTKDTTCKQDFRNGTLVTLKRKYVSKPLHMLNNWTHQIVCFDQPMKSDQSDFFFSYFTQVDGIELLLHNVALVMDSWFILEMRGGRGNRLAIFMQPTLLGVQSWVRFCQQEFWEFPRLVGRYCSYLLPKQAGGTPQILVDKTSPMTGRLRVYISCDNFAYHRLD